MRRALLLCLAMLAVAGPAGAQAKKKFSVPAATKPAAAAPAPATPVLPASLAPGLDPRGPILPPVAGPVGGAAQQCRTSCAQSYYFCLSDGRSDDCSTSWSQCRLACGASDRAGY